MMESFTQLFYAVLAGVILIIITLIIIGVALLVLCLLVVGLFIAPIVATVQFIYEYLKIKKLWPKRKKEDLGVM